MESRCINATLDREIFNPVRFEIFTGNDKGYLIGNLVYKGEDDTMIQ
jgi:hypothetical protein